MMLQIYQFQRSNESQIYPRLLRQTLNVKKWKNKCLSRELKLFLTHSPAKLKKKPIKTIALLTKAIMSSTVTEKKCITI